MSPIGRAPLLAGLLAVLILVFAATATASQPAATITPGVALPVLPVVHLPTLPPAPVPIPAPAPTPAPALSPSAQQALLRLAEQGITQQSVHWHTSAHGVVSLLGLLAGRRLSGRRRAAPSVALGVEA